MGDIGDDVEYEEGFLHSVLSAECKSSPSSLMGVQSLGMEMAVETLVVVVVTELTTLSFVMVPLTLTSVVMERLREGRGVMGQEEDEENTIVFSSSMSSRSWIQLFRSESKESRESTTSLPTLPPSSSVILSMFTMNFLGWVSFKEGRLMMW